MVANAFGYIAAVIVVGAWIQWFRLINQVRIPSDRTAFVVVNGAGALIGIAAFLLGASTLAGVAAGIAVFAGIMFIGLVAGSGQAPNVPAVAVGQPIFAFEASDDEGKPFSVGDLRGKPFLLKFFRGHW